MPKKRRKREKRAGGQRRREKKVEATNSNFGPRSGKKERGEGRPRPCELKKNSQLGKEKRDQSCESKREELVAFSLFSRFSVGREEGR